MPYPYFSPDETCLVLDVHTGHLHALKTFSFDPNIGVTNLNEIDILTRFRHPSLLGFSHLVQLDVDCWGLILPIGRWTLDNIIDKEYLWTKQDRINLLWQLSHGLAFLHQHHINHNNLTLSEIIIRKNERDHLEAIIADFSEVSYWTKRGTKNDLRRLGIIFLQIITRQKDLDENRLFDENRCLPYLQSLVKDADVIGLVDLIFLMLDSESPLTSQEVVTSSFFKHHQDVVNPLTGVDLEKHPEKKINYSLLARLDAFHSERNDYQLIEDPIRQRAVRVYLEYFDSNDVFEVVLFIVYKMSYRVGDTTVMQVRRNLVQESGLSDDLFRQLELDYLINFVDSRPKV